MWSETPFWHDRTCPDHGADGTQRCTSCTRYRPRGEVWADLDDGRTVCLDCLHTIVVDTADAQPLYRQVSSDAPWCVHNCRTCACVPSSARAAGCSAVPWIKLAGGGEITQWSFGAGGHPHHSLPLFLLLYQAARLRVMSRLVVC